MAWVGSLCIGPGPSPAVALANAMSSMKRSVPPDAFMVAAKLLLAYTTNIVNHPGDPKYRRIKVCCHLLLFANVVKIVTAYSHCLQLFNLDAKAAYRLRSELWSW